MLGGFFRSRTDQETIMAKDRQNHDHLSANPKTADLAGASNREKDPADWTTGDEPMTGAQASYLKTLTEETGEQFDPNLTKADASRRIDELRARAGLADQDARRSRGRRAG
jgi:hypothetical protein